MILALIPFGKTANGATRWIRFGPIGVQPADVSKTAVIIMLSAAVCAAGSKIKSLWYNFFLFVLIAGLEAILIMMISSNMSSALIILAIAFVMIFVAYPKYKFSWYSQDLVRAVWQRYITGCSALRIRA